MIRYITDYIRYLPVSALNHLMIERDFPMGLIPLIEDKPWLRVKNEKREKYEDSKWQVVKKHEYGKLPKIEGQIWIALYNLLMTKESADKYEITDYRKGNLLRV